MKLTVLLIALVLTAPLARAYPLYHDISDTPAAQAEAHERGLPIAYLGVIPGVLEQGTPAPGSDAELAQTALNTLQGRAVVITFNGLTMASVPDFVHAQFHIGDDGPLGGGAAWLVPKVVFTDPGITKILGRVSHTQMKSGVDEPLNSALQIILNDPHALEPVQPAAAPAAKTDSAVSPDQIFGVVSWIVNNWIILAAGVLLFCVILMALAGRRAR